MQNLRKILAIRHKRQKHPDPVQEKLIIEIEQPYNRTQFNAARSSFRAGQQLSYTGIAKLHQYMAANRIKSISGTNFQEEVKAHLNQILTFTMEIINLKNYRDEEYATYGPLARKLLNNKLYPWKANKPVKREFENNNIGFEIGFGENTYFEVYVGKMNGNQFERLDEIIIAAFCSSGKHYYKMSDLNLCKKAVEYINNKADYIQKTYPKDRHLPETKGERKCQLQILGELFQYKLKSRGSQPPSLFLNAIKNKQRHDLQYLGWRAELEQRIEEIEQSPISPKKIIALANALMAYDYRCQNLMHSKGFQKEKRAKQLAIQYALRPLNFFYKTREGQLNVACKPVCVDGVTYLMKPLVYTTNSGDKIEFNVTLGKLSRGSIIKPDCYEAWGHIHGNRVEGYAYNRRIAYKFEWFRALKEAHIVVDQPGLVPQPDYRQCQELQMDQQARKEKENWLESLDDKNQPPVGHTETVPAQTSSARETEPTSSNEDDGLTNYERNRKNWTDEIDPWDERGRESRRDELRGEWTWRW